MFKQLITCYTAYYVLFSKPYIKLSYPNGVTLILPTTLDIKTIEQYIRICEKIVGRQVPDAILE